MADEKHKPCLRDRLIEIGVNFEIRNACHRLDRKAMARCDNLQEERHQLVRNVDSRGMNKRKNRKNCCKTETINFVRSNVRTLKFF